MGEPRAVDEIITRCARLPLALSIVAAHAAAHPGFPLSAIVDELRESHGSLDAFAGGEDLSTDVRAVFSWSYKALSAPAARLFHLLSLHSGPDISAPAAAALAGLPPREARGLLVELTRAHLLSEHFPGRYTLHDLLRVYAAERVRAEEAPGERDRAVERLLSWYLHTADAAYPHITPRRQRIALDPPPPGCRPLEFTTYDDALGWCEKERGNLVSAVHTAAASGHPGIAWRLPAVLWGFFYLRSHMHDWLDTARVGLAAARAAHDRVGEAQGLADLAAAERSSGRFDETIDYLRRAMVAYRDLGDHDGRGSAVSNLGDAYLQTGQLAKAVEYTRRGLAIERVIGSAWGEGIALSNLGDAYQRLGRFGEAVDCLDQALVILRANGNLWVEGITLGILGTVHRRLGHYDAAVEYHLQALRTHRDIGNRWGEGHTLSNLGDVRLDAREPEAARESWLQALAIFVEFDHPDAEKVRARLGRLENGPPGSRRPGGCRAGTDRLTYVSPSIPRCRCLRGVPCVPCVRCVLWRDRWLRCSRCSRSGSGRGSGVRGPGRVHQNNGPRRRPVQPCTVRSKTVRGQFRPGSVRAGVSSRRGRRGRRMLAVAPSYRPVGLVTVESVNHA